MSGLFDAYATTASDCIRWSLPTHILCSSGHRKLLETQSFTNLPARLRGVSDYGARQDMRWEGFLGREFKLRQVSELVIALAIDS